MINDVKSRPKRRHRKQCAFYLDGIHSQNNCTNHHFRKEGSWVYPKCIGVNCGHFAKFVEW